MERCMGCMEELPDNAEVCSYCGYRKETDVKEAYYLLPETIVGEKYVVGKVLGYGGFGVTYIGWDSVLKRKVAIKEYLPSSFATRSYGTRQLTVYSGEAAEQFEAGLNSFISEAKRLARFNSVPEIVDIYDCFMENGSGYIIMEYLEGITVKELLKEQEKIPADEARKIVMSVLNGLAAVHGEGIIHRDIAPDNIFITKQGEVRLLDFGAARYAAAVQSRSLSVILKPGYAPEEQYRSHGEQGPWTDIYALGATFYRMVTGVRPQESIERLANDQVVPPSRLGIVLEPNLENAIMNSINVRREFRFQDAKSFYDALESKERVARIVEKKEKPKQAGVMHRLKPVLAVLVCLAVLATGIFLFLNRGEAGSVTASAPEEKDRSPETSGAKSGETEQAKTEEKETEQDSGNMTEEKTAMLIVPDLKGLTQKQAQESLETLYDQMGYTFLIGSIKKEYSSTVKKGKIISQSLEAGSSVRSDVFLDLVISKGPELKKVPYLIGMSREAAEAKLKDLGFEVQTKTEYSSTVAAGLVSGQDTRNGAKLEKGSTITITVSLGPKPSSGNGGSTGNGGSSGGGGSSNDNRHIGPSDEDRTIRPSD